MIQSLLAPHPTFQKQLDAVETHLKSWSAKENKKVSEGISDLIKAGGKRIRPLLVLIGASFGHPGDDLVRVAAIPEMIHLASLVHDDVIDAADTRRGVETLHKRYGQHLAVYAGDYLLMTTLIEVGEFFPYEVLKKMSNQLTDMVRAELIQMQEKGSWETDLKTYLRIIRGKTARLMTVSMTLGTTYAHVTPSRQRQLTRIAHDLGMAFQIKDDILDYASSLDHMGKPTMHDARNGHSTLPLIFKFAKKPEYKSRFLKLMKKDDWESIKGDLEETILDAQKIAEKYTDKALKRIDSLPDGEGKTVLKALVEVLCLRKH